MATSLQKDGVAITILDGAYLADGKPTPRAVADYTHLIEQLGTIKAYAADELLELYHDDWLDKKIGRVDRAGFIGMLGKPSINLYDSVGVAAVYFDDGGLFAGHSVEIMIENGRPVSADIVG
jgi:hypothetical protein